MDKLSKLNYTVRPALCENGILHFNSRKKTPQIENGIAIYSWFDHSPYCYGHRIIDHFYLLWLLITYLGY